MGANLLKGICWALGLAVGMGGAWLIHNHVDGSGLRTVLQMVLAAFVVSICQMVSHFISAVFDHRAGDE